jgi:hypothetical protein
MTSDTANWLKFAKEFHRRDTDYVMEAIAGYGLVDKRCTYDELAEVLSEKEPWENALQLPEGATLLAYGLFACGMQEWELNIDHPPIQLKLANAKKAWANAQTDRSEQNFSCSPDYYATSILMSLTDSLIDAMDAENALNNSSTVALGRLASNIVQRSVVSLAKLTPFDDRSRPFRIFLEDIIGTQLNFYIGLEKFASTLLDCQLGRTDGGLSKQTIDDTIRELKTLEQTLQPDVLATELPAYRNVLSALSHRVDDSKPVVKFESVRFRYVYPFTCDALDDDQNAYRALVERMLDPSSSGSYVIAGVPAGPARAAIMTDLFTWGSSQEPEHGGLLPTAVDITMPDLAVQDQDGKFINGYRVKIRIGKFGQHYLRIEKDLPNPHLHDINQGLRRPSVFIGREKTAIDGAAPYGDSLSNDNPASTNDAAQWPCLDKYAEQVIRDTRDVINVFVSKTLERDKPSSFNGAFGQLFHTVLEIRSATVPTTDGGRQEATDEEILGFAKRLLFQPIDRLATAPEEWMCYREPRETRNLIEEDSFESDFIVSRGNTTALYLPATPDWLIDSYEEAIEFIATEPAQLSERKRRLKEAVEVAKGKLDGMHNNGHGDEGSRALLERLGNLDAAQLNLAVAIGRARKSGTGLDNLLEVVEEVGHVHQMRLLKQLLPVANVSELLEKLHADLEGADLLHERIRELGRHLRDDLDRRYQNRLQLILLGVGLFSFAGVLSLVEQEVFGSNEDSYHHGAVWRDMHPGLNLVITGLFYIVVCVMGSVLALIWRVRYKRPKREDGFQDLQSRVEVESVPLRGVPLRSID